MELGSIAGRIYKTRDVLIKRWEISETRIALLGAIDRVKRSLPPVLVKIFLFILWNLIFGIPALIILLWLVVYKKVRKLDDIYFFGIVFYRLGHLALEPYVFLKREEKSGEKNSLAIGFGYLLPICNQQLLDMYRRKIPIIDSIILEKILTLSFLRKTRYVRYIHWDDKDTGEFNDQKPVLRFTPEETAKGRELLKKMGIGENDRYVCFHSRDRTYLGRGSEHHDFRDCNIDNFMLAANYIVEKGGFAIRMGAAVDKPLPGKRHPRIIDYAVEHRSDFMDVYLTAHCKFFLGVNTGLMCIPSIFNVPIANVNVIPVDVVPRSPKDLYITKKLWDLKKGRYLTLPEIFGSDLAHMKFSASYEKAGIVLHENTPEEILALAKEMDGQINGALAPAKEEELLRAAFNSLIKPYHHSYGNPSRIAVSFLSMNKYLCYEHIKIVKSGTNIVYTEEEYENQRQLSLIKSRITASANGHLLDKKQ